MGGPERRPLARPRQCRARHPEPSDLWRADVDRTVAGHYRAVLPHRRHRRFRRGGRRRMDGSGHVAFRRSAPVDADPDLRLRHSFRARLRAAGPHYHDRHSRFDQGFSAGALCGDQHRKPGIRRGRTAARGGLVVDRDPRGSPECNSAADGRIRPTLLLHFSVYRSAQLSRARRAAAGRRLGQHGEGLSRHDQFWVRCAALSGSRDSNFDHRGEFRRRLDAVNPLKRPGRRRMSVRPEGASRSRDNSVILNVQGMRVVVRTDTGEGPVLVDDVSLQLRRGEVIGLIGESGAGKSTIGLASMGYTRRDCHIVGGNIIFGDTDIRAITLDERRALRGPKIAYIAQSAAASFNPAHTLMEQVCEASVRHDVLTRAEARAAAIRLFRELDLPSPETIGSRYPHQVSGGQLQRVMAAMAMVAKPDILIFDEPTTALDVTTQVECLAAFRKLIRGHGTAALYITHDLAVVAQIADRIMVLRRGKMVEFGDSRQILQQPKEEYTRRLVTERVAGHSFVDANGAGEVPILAIEHVSLDVRKGDTVAVVGESGSGKSTLARVVTGLLPRVAGDVRFNGLSLPPRLKDRSKDQLRRVQMIYQMPDVALNPQHTLLETIGRPVAFYFNRSRD